jgi:hypothetical protein
MPRGQRVALARLAGVTVRREELDRKELDAFEKARAAGVTWQQIADRCGYAGRQGAQMRYKTLLERAGTAEETEHADQ